MGQIKMPQMIREIAAAIFKKSFTRQYPLTRPESAAGYALGTAPPGPSRWSRSTVKRCL